MGDIVMIGTKPKQARECVKEEESNYHNVVMFGKATYVTALKIDNYKCNLGIYQDEVKAAKI